VSGPVVLPGGVLVVEAAGLEAAVEDADEPVGELAQGCVVADVPAAQRVVVGRGTRVMLGAENSFTSCDQAIFADQVAGASLPSGAVPLKDRPARVAVSAARLRSGSGAAGADCGGSRTRAGSAADGLVPDERAVQEFAAASAGPRSAIAFIRGSPHVARHGPDAGGGQDRVECAVKSGPRSRSTPRWDAA
jgi:hypothetical protein